MTISETSLAATLRVWRDRLTPTEVGLPAGWSRRAAGLRREELADLAGDTDLKIVAMTAPTGSEDASKIELARMTSLTDLR